MNCKQGDLARVVAVTNPDALHCVGWIVLCTEPTAGLTSEPGWFTTPAADGKWGFFDKNLRPIRDPGEDVQDETLSWLPVPNMETV